jgi:ADP-L-glycero-D-manno-heptose 6-epimerase
MSQSTSPVLVTGAAGFIGARLCQSLTRAGRPVVGVDVESLFQSRKEIAGLQIPFVRRVDRDAALAWLSKEKPALSAIVHLGACTDTFELDRALLARLNVDFSKRIWEYATENRIPLVYASSAATYGDGAFGYDDSEELMPKLKPLNPYGDSKQEFDLWALAQEKAGVCPPTWSGFKFFNVYGFGERHKGRMATVVLQAFDQIRKTGEVKLFRSHKAGIADGEQRRDFIYVGDVVEVLQFALSRPIERGIYNLGTGQARSFLSLARAVFRALDVPEKISFIDTPVELRDRYQYLTEARIDRLRAQGYLRPFHSLEEGVRETVRELLA